MATHAAKHALVYGGAGALGRAVVAHLRTLPHWTVTSVDFAANPDAHRNIALPPLPPNWTAAAESVLAATPGELDAVVCVAGGWVGGHAGDASFVQSVETSVAQSVQSSAVAAHIAAKRLNPNGLVVLTGSQASLSPTPGMIGYGLAKAAVHHLVRSLGAGTSAGLPTGATALGILPVTLDTPMNRKFMPDADFSSWTPLETVAAQVASWAEDPSARPKSGALVEVVTKAGVTAFTPVKE
ncbi:hypothetical protein AMAG_06750 [Allomyces macrogynus ATCC 38327]|uniref:Dihydropteridine reductase n=1 Tax=Allomyces macrogynus (strain ATCC 38327) TaxID=578462 RepID=A0A0L0SET2_ALLM3|nr:hypothetical protein AMAG_06750 [Allomyces macrogynus ATCC 38327]|eukprot:KNE60986.1 hypothetical protein AMAG_06750 [Allomyces macrogynus ATCC 38327]